MSTRLRAVVLTYGTGREFEPLLESLDDEGIAEEQVLIVHNPSTPGEPAPAPAGYEVIAASHNLGYAAGMNLGIDHQLERGCDLVLVLTHDARFRAGGLRNLIAAAAANSSHGVFGPTLLLTGTETPFSYGGQTKRGGHISHRRRLGAVAAGLTDCDWVDGGTMLIRAEVLDRVGSFDERFWGYVEDADFCLRARRAGFAVAVAVDSRADQEPGMVKRLGPWAYLVTRNQIAYGWRYAGVFGAVATGGRALWDAIFATLRTAIRVTRLRPGPPVETWAVAVGTWRGLAAICSGKWGPPPPRLPGGGDIGNVDPPADG